MTSASRPQIFISSTVYDFRDLRSALKYWLTELDYRVVLSDVADFPKAIEENSYEACLHVIDSCDYFILLIGARIGGWYDKPNKISITRREYRHAYERAKQGKIKIIPFVRRDIWDAREDRKGLEDVIRAEYQQSKELTDDQVRALVRHHSQFVNDADTTFSFIAEVTRSEEMKDGINTGNFPRNNWIHPFSTFEDVAATIKATLNITTSLRRRGLIASLRHEIFSNLQKVIRRKGKELYIKSGVAAWQRLQTNSAITKDGLFALDRGVALDLAMHQASIRTEFETTILDEALRSGEFLEYDANSHGLRVGTVHRSLLVLSQAIGRLRLQMKSPEFLVAHMKLDETGQHTVVARAHLVSALAQIEAREHVIFACINACRALNGDDRQLPIHSKLDEETGNLTTAAHADLDEIERWVDTYEPVKE